MLCNWIMEYSWPVYRMTTHNEVRCDYMKMCTGQRGGHDWMSLCACLLKINTGEEQGIVVSIQRCCVTNTNMLSLIARFIGPIWGPSGANRTQVGPMLAPWTLLSGVLPICDFPSYLCNGNPYTFKSGLYIERDPSYGDYFCQMWYIGTHYSEIVQKIWCFNSLWLSDVT